MREEKIAWLESHYILGLQPERRLLQRVCSNNNKFDVLTGDRMIQGCRVYGPSVEIL